MRHHITPPASDRGCFLLPLPLPGQAVVEADFWLPAEVSAEPGRVREGVPLVADPGRLGPHGELLSGDPLELAEDVADADHLAATDVVGLADLGVRRGDDGVDAVGNE